MRNLLVCKNTTPNKGDGNPINNKGRANIKLEDLPEDMLCTILSKLPTKEAARTSVLSSRWRSMWTISPNLCFDVTMFASNKSEPTRHAWEFVHNVNACLQKLHGKVVKGLEVKFDFNNLLVDHINSWVSFAVLSKTKSLALDLEPANETSRFGDRYMFPFELFDGESIRNIKFFQLSFVSFKPPSQFRGFPNLRKLDLNFLHITTKALEDMLSNCCNLESLSIIRCPLNDRLKVDRSLPRLSYILIVFCKVTKVEFDAANLSTFVYKGAFVPIVLNHASKLEHVQISFDGAIFRHALVALLNDLPNIQNLTFHICHLRLETQLMWDIHCKFAQLRHLQLTANIDSGDSEKILNLVSVLHSAPLIERLEVHFSGNLDLWFSKKGHPRHQLQKCEYNHLKNVYITGYKAARGQSEFVLHVAENAPVLEVLSIEITQIINDDIWADYIDGSSFERANKHARCYIGPKLSPYVKFSVTETLPRRRESRPC